MTSRANLFFSNTRDKRIPFILADITYLNVNVVYAIGFTIGSGKGAYLIRDKTIAGDREVAGTAGIFDTLGYPEPARSSHVLKHSLIPPYFLHILCLSWLSS